jgi:glutathione S-transferase
LLVKTASLSLEIDVSELVLYHAVPSRSIVVHWMLEEVGEPYDIELLSLDAEDHKKPEYLAVNPMGRVPALCHGDVVVTETAAICAYFAEAFPDAGLDIPAGSPCGEDQKIMQGEAS